MVEMKEREFQKWTETRKKGKFYFIFNNSLLALLIAFMIFFFGNAIENRDELKDYIDSFFFQIYFNLIVLAIAFVFLLIISSIFWAFNEKRYSQAENNFKEIEKSK